MEGKYRSSESLMEARFNKNMSEFSREAETDVALSKLPANEDVVNIGWQIKYTSHGLT